MLLKQHTEALLGPPPAKRNVRIMVTMPTDAANDPRLVSDAANSQRAVCVMLNKGKHIVKALQTLDNILQRMQSHQHKKRSMLRPLELAGRFPQ